MRIINYCALKVESKLKSKAGIETKV